MHDFLHHLRLKNYRNRRVGMIENGSWAPIAAKLMREMLQPLQGIEIVEPVVTVRSRLNAANIDQLEALADAMASDPDTNV
jgi:flavorubredoxin